MRVEPIRWGTEVPQPLRTNPTNPNPREAANHLRPLYKPKKAPRGAGPGRRPRPASRQEGGAELQPVRGSRGAPSARKGLYPQCRWRAGRPPPLPQPPLLADLLSAAPTARALT